MPISVDRIALIRAVRQMLLNSSPDRFAIVIDVDNVGATITSRLPAADVDHGNAEVGALAHAYARVADQALRVAEEAQEIRALHVLEEVHLLRLHLLAEFAHTRRCSIGARVDVRPEPERRQSELMHRM